MAKSATYQQILKFANQVTAEIQEAKNSIVFPVYELVQQEVAEPGFYATYQFTKDKVAVGSKINIPKDRFLIDSKVLQVAEENKPYDGAAVGDYYIYLLVGTADGGENAHYIPVNQLFHPYHAGKGISIADQNIALVINETLANGLSVTEAGLQLAPATQTTPGAMSAADKAKLDAIEYATDEEFDAMLAEVFGGSSTEPKA